MTNLWSTSSTTSKKKTACQRSCIIHLQQVAVFTPRLLLENWACMQIAKCASADLCVCATRCLLVPPSVSPNSPLPCFAKADPVSSTNKPFSGYLCAGPGREDGSGLETERWEFCWSSDPVGCICKASTAVNSGSTLAFFLCRISFFQLFQLYPLTPCLIEAGLGLRSGLL